MKAEPSIQRSFRVKREFGLIVGAVFTLLGWLYRGKLTVVAEVTLLFGVVLIVLGLIFPKSLVYPNRAWILLAEALAYDSTRIIPASSSLQFYSDRIGVTDDAQRAARAVCFL